MKQADPYSAEAVVAFEALAGRVDALTEALTGCVQYGVDEDGRAWIAANPSGVDRAAEVLGIDAAFIRAAGLVPGRQDRPGKELGGAGGARGTDAEKPA